MIRMIKGSVENKMKELKDRIYNFKMDQTKRQELQERFRVFQKELFQLKTNNVKIKKESTKMINEINWIDDLN